MKKKIHIDKKILAGYIGAFLLVLGLAFFGSSNKGGGGEDSLNMSALAANSFSVSADQLSEFYVVASLANAMDFNSSEVLSSNYVTVSVMLEAGQSATDKLEKPTVVDTSDLSRDGVKIHIVKSGETMEDIATEYGVSTDQIRWSNDLKDTDVAEGDRLYVPGVAGIVYKVKEDETIGEIIERTGALEKETLILNDLENDATLKEGELIVLVNGELPEEERPEYEPPKPVYTPVYTYSYAGSSSSRIDLAYVAYGFYVSSPGNPGLPGQCTWYAWYMRDTDANSLGRLPGGLGNANSWAYTLAAQGYRVDNTPEVGAVFQTASGWYGHVGYVVGVNDDGSVRVREMNYNYITYAVSEATIPANLASNLNYIH